MPPPQSKNIIVVPVFSGQGSGRASLGHASGQAIHDATSPLGSLLLSSCLDAFLVELCVLSPEELDQSGICPSDFRDPLSLLSPQPKYSTNQIISGTFLFLAQVLRYQSYVRSTCSRLSPNSLKTNVDHGVGILGLSSGIFPACVVAASENPLAYITTAVEVFRVVFWIGFRVLQFTRKFLRDNPVDCILPWSVACLGLTNTDVREHIVRFEQEHGLSPSLRVTAVLDEQYVTVSGRPDVLKTFSAFVSRYCTVHETTMDAFYHSQLHLPSTREEILADVIKHKIQFPDFHDLHCPLRSTISGALASPSHEQPSLIHLVIDMVLIHPVNWVLVAKEVAHSIPPDGELQVVNIGPSSGTLRALEKALPDQVIRCLDATSDRHDAAAIASPKQEPIAIVGMAAHTPGASDTSELWEILERGVSTVAQIPEDRFNHTSFMNGETGASPRAMTVETGNFMSNFTHFDHKFFKVSPREARSMDPQQRILLHTAYEALENAGYVPDATPSFRRETFGCYIGAATHDYADNLRNDIDIHYSTGTLKAFLSGRISYFMQFGGPSIVVDTACSSSIVAIYQACRALMNKDCNAALAGGVNVMSSPDMFIGLERGHFLNTSGQCKSFDASADGYSRSEGCCVFVLKRLCDAVAENDNILGIIRGVEVNQSGLAHSITHPHSPTQSDLLRKLLRSCAIQASCVSVVEAHGTGTQAGDSCEVASIRSVLAQGRTRDNPLHVTSIKANIGHLEAASGAVGLCKLLLMLRHNLIPAQISLNTLNPLIPPLDVDNTIIDTFPSSWTSGSAPRFALLNNFGAAGSNGALMVEEYIKPVHHTAMSHFVVGISANSADALENLRRRYIQWLCDLRNHNVPLCDIAYTATARRQLFPFRLAVTASDKEQLIRALGTTSTTHVDDSEGRVIFVFSGQGSQYFNMAAPLYATSLVFKACIDRCQNYLISLGYPGILPMIAPEHCDYVLPPNAEFEAHQSAVLALEFALSSLWKHWGLVPAGAIGQSLGEYAAMVTAEVLSIETALSIVAKRARLMAQACAFETTGMLSVSLEAQKFQEILDTCGAFPHVTIACINTESSCVVSGPIDELHTLAAYLSVVQGCRTVCLDVPLGFHSAAMDPILTDLKTHVTSLSIKPPSIPIASNVYGTVILPGDGSTFRAEYFTQHCRQPVLFVRGLRALERHLDPARIGAWVDIGSHATCLPMIDATLSPSSDTLLLPSMLKHAHPWDTLSNSLSRLYRTGVPVNWRRVFSELSPCSCVDLPSYPFEMQTFWVPHSKHSTHLAPAPTITVQAPDHPMLSSWSQYPSRQTGNVAIFDTPIGILSPYIDGHKVGGYALCPASVYLEQAFAGAILTQRHMSLDFGRCMPILRDVKFSRPLVHRDEIRRIVRTHVTVHEDGTGAFSVTSMLESSREESVHVHGDIRFSSIRETTSNLALELPTIARHVEVVTSPRNGETPEVFTTRTAYEVIFPRVVEYSKDYHTIQSLTVSGDGVAGVARIALPMCSSPRSLAAQPVFVDTLLHVAGFMANMQGDVSDAYICSDVGSLKILHDLVNDKQPYTVHCIHTWVSSRDFVTADIFAVEESDPQVVVAQLQGVQFRRVRLTSLHRGLAIAADTAGTKIRKRTNSNAIITPSSPRSVIFARSHSNTHNTNRFSRTELTKLDVDDGESTTTCSGPLSPLTLVSESGAFEKGVPDIDEERIRMIIAEVLGLADCQEIKDESDFRSLGLDSLGSIEAQQALRVALDRPIPHNIFTTCPTFSSLCEFFADDFIPVTGNVSEVETPGEPALEQQQHLSERALVPLQRCTDGSHAPLFLIHDGSGLVSHYERLSPLRRDIWGLNDPRFFSDEPWGSIEAMAQAYALAIEIHVKDTLILGGWSFGGVVAFEVARILTARGINVNGVILIDSPAPSAPPLLSDVIINHVVRGEERNVESAMAPLVMRQFKRNTQLLEVFIPADQDTQIPLTFLRSTKGFHPPGIEGIPTWFSERHDAESVVRPWETLVGRPVKVWDIPGHHFEPFSPEHVQETSVQLDRACRYLEAL
ncbi:putative polyketide synthase [Paxillus ammoniavirescens]|nr:putative polyketide synthase [Paxillus ammoniavirescens]